MNVCAHRLGANIVQCGAGCTRTTGLLRSGRMRAHIATRVCERVQCAHQRRIV